MAILERRRSLAAALGSIACLPIAAGIAFWVEGRVVAGIAGSEGDAISPVLADSSGQGRWLAAVEALLGVDLASRAGVVGVAVVLATAIGARALGQDRSVEAILCFALGGALYVLRGTVTTGPIFGLLPASPALVVGVTALVVLWRRWHRDDVWILLGGSALGTMLGVMATQYGNGGGVSVGSRYLLTVAVPLAALAAVGLKMLWELHSTGLHAATGAALGALVACSLVANLGSVRVHKDDDLVLVQTIRSTGVSTVITTVPSLPAKLGVRTTTSIGCWRAEDGVRGALEVPSRLSGTTWWLRDLLAIRQDPGPSRSSRSWTAGGSQRESRSSRPSTKPG